MSEQTKWGSYYDNNQSKRPFVLKMVHTANEWIPTFEELFDEETFYVFAFLFFVATILVVIFLAKYCGIQIKEYDVFREPAPKTTSWKPPNPFKSPFQHWDEIKNLAKNYNKAKNEAETKTK